MFKWLSNKFKKITHRCSPIRYEETGEVITFHWDVPWSFSQKFQVCTECGKVEVISEVRNDNRGSYRKEKNGRIWSGSCDFAKVPSIGRDKLTIGNKELQARYLQTAE
jgi:hypothetical protein